MDAYYLDSSNPNPFEDRVPCKPFLFFFFPRAEYVQGVTLNILKADLARADANDRKSGVLHGHRLTPFEFISEALDIEEQQ